MNRTRHAQIHLPPLTPHEALRLVQCLERAVGAIWRAHGEEMSELLLGQHDCSEAVVPPGSVEASDLPF